jgi:hypothetical protein
MRVSIRGQLHKSLSREGKADAVDGDEGSLITRETRTNPLSVQVH